MSPTAKPDPHRHTSAHGGASACSFARRRRSSAAYGRLLAWNPAPIRPSVAILRDAWDWMCGATDAARPFATLGNAPLRRHLRITRRAHLMRLEESRRALYRNAKAFLGARDTAEQED